MNDSHANPRPPTDRGTHEGKHLASRAPPRRAVRTVLYAFVVTFALARVLVYLIMARRIPDLFLHLGGTHVHHLNYGIFALSAVGLWLLLAQPVGRAFSACASLYGVGLALTFDEFGMWLHLGGSYWQRASFDAVVVIASSLALLAWAPHPREFRARHWIGLAVVLATLALFGGLLSRSLATLDRRVGPSLERLEEQGPR